MEHLKTFEAACEVLGLDPTILPEVSRLDESRAKAQIAIYKLDVLSDAAWKKEGKIIDWNDFNQRKYYPWFKLKGSPGGFSYGVYRCDYSCSLVGSRLVFPTVESMKFIEENYLDLYKDFMLR